MWGNEMARQLKVTQPFNLALSLTMGQAFRWRPLDAGWFSGVLGENLLHIRQTDAGLEYRIGGPCGERDATDQDDELLLQYFREDDDVAAIYSSIGRDPKLATIMREFPGLRLLRQDPWECLVTYLCSANNNLPRIAYLVNAIADKFGTEVALGREQRCTFPTAEQLAKNPEQTWPKLKDLRLGLNRAPNLMTAAQIVCTGELDLHELRRQPYLEVRKRLLQCDGIGRKVADCIALFALDQTEAFPVDIWVWRAITEAFPEWGFPEQAQPTIAQKAAVDQYARHEFGKYAGYANQYLFYWRRQHGKEPLPFGTRWRGKFRITPPADRQIDDQYLDELRHEHLKAKYFRVN